MPPSRLTWPALLALLSCGHAPPVDAPVPSTAPILRASGSFKPAYPRAVQQVGVQGGAVLDIAVTDEGRAVPGESSVVSSTNKVFVDSLRPYLGGLRFTPARAHQRAVAGHLVVKFSYLLDTACTQWEAPPHLAWSPDSDPPSIRITSCMHELGMFNPKAARALARRRATSPPPATFDTVARALGLEPLHAAPLPKGTREIRLWVGGGITVPDNMLRLVRQGDRVSGALGAYWQRINPYVRPGHPQEWETVRTFLGARCTAFADSGNHEACWYRLSHAPDWRRLWDSLVALHVATLKDQVLVNHRTQLIDDGFGMTVEYRDGARYRWYEYSNPNAYADREDSLAYAVDRATWITWNAVVPSDAKGGG